MCIISVYGCKNRTYRVGHYHDILHQCMHAEVWGLKQSKNSQNVSFCPSKLTCIHGIFNFEVFSVTFLL